MEKKRNSIVLPIKEEYVDKIFSGQKKYEYRKRLCTEDIDTIYVYETSPIKLVVGRAEVRKKIYGSKDAVWKMTEKYAGVRKEFYEDYFKNQETASAYVLGRTERFDMPVTLAEFGINSVPQSFCYIKTEMKK